MNRRIRRPELEDFLEGNLDPAKHAEIARRLESDPQSKRECEELAAMVALLGTSLDTAPSFDLVANAMREIEARRMQPVRRFVIRFEKGLVAIGAAGLAAALTLAGVLPVPESSRWVGALAVEATGYLAFLKTATVLLTNGLGSFDWVAHVLQSLSIASQEVVLSSMRDLQPMMPAAALLTILTAMGLWRAEHGRRERGMSGGLHLFA
jgi:anti-sigma factor RsiW